MADKSNRNDKTIFENTVYKSFGTLNKNLLRLRSAKNIFLKTDKINGRLFKGANTCSK